MPSKGTEQKKYQHTRNVITAVIHKIRIAAFFYSTAFDSLRRSLPQLNKPFSFCAPVINRVRLFALYSRKQHSRFPRCRSPPSDFDFAYQLKNRNWRNHL